ncbi:mechanosensitive ion channel domain-containing protein [Edwardsiella ictaluri]|uniref:Mechanosensitive ion channel family protein n=1 Tax=Edwardsiella ictaluri TaxID=67780 RepID=A0ABY8GFS2_EDWIC|nr:mechanosensitive ion channel domain-containing protein [Edwardsiella ictaluri]ARD38375.1 mechanosensitive ion channel protein MscS [Edwardsiella ictaluri]ELV7527809.1 mechanosensitive ion channel [Edwardsiella ictaluri]KMQ77616.1 mechanosensitive ion channel protein MscS [Edwardsiella ictaluri]KOO54457.1 mechanosensitive ion channel protein MscS [Edwardsiella ictaluri]QPW26792.1 mechanosensitive ion channel [Edwardsiella ictaluri]
MALIVEKLHAHLILAAVLLLLSAMVYGLRQCRGNRGTTLLQVAQILLWLLLVLLLCEGVKKYLVIVGLWPWIKYISFCQTVLIIFVLFKAISSAINIIADRQVKNGINRSKTLVAIRAINILILFLLATLFGEQLGLNMSGLLTFGGVGGVAIGIASRNILSNLLSGVMLYFDRPFNVGDWIRLPEKNTEGVVTEIGLRTTKIVTFDQKPLYIPNSVFSSIMIENPGRSDYRKVELAAIVKSFDAQQVSTLLGLIGDKVAQDPRVNRQLDTFIHMHNITKDGIQILISLFANTRDYDVYLTLRQSLIVYTVDTASAQGLEVTC